MNSSSEIAAKISPDSCNANQKQVRRRSRFVLLTLLIAGLLVIAGSGVWFLNRPLNDVEQKLVGTWRNTTVGMTFTLTKDRTFFKGGQRYGGRWYVNGNEMYYPDEFPKELERTIWSLLRRNPNRKIAHITTFDDDNHVTVFVPVNGCTFYWERLGEQSE